MKSISARLAALFQKQARRGGAPARKPRALLHLDPLESRYAPAVLTVNTTADTSQQVAFSLRDAIRVVNAQSTVGFNGAQVSGTLGQNDTIVFDPTVFTTGATITLGTAALPTISVPVSIQGQGTDRVLNANSLGSVLQIAAGVTASVSNITLTGGRTATVGGGINNSGNLTVDRVLILNNAATLNGGGINNNVTGSLTLTNSTVLNNNSATGSGGGIYSFGGTVTIANTTVSGNFAGDGGGIFNGGAGGVMSVTNSTVNRNTSGSRGGGVENGGTLTVTNSTISANTSAAATITGAQWFPASAIVSNATWDLTSTTATVTTAVDHGFVVGQTVTVSAVNSAGPGSFNGSVVVTGVPTSTSFTFALATDPGAFAGGGNVTGGPASVIFTTAGPHGFAAAQVVTVASVVPGAFNGGYTITAVPTPTTFRVTLGVNPGTYSGGGTVSGGSVLGGGLFNSVATAQVRLGNTIIAGNQNGDISGTGVSTTVSFNNVIGTGGSGGLVSGTNGNQTNVAAALIGLDTTLSNNGGPTRTLALLANSTALDRGAALATLSALVSAGSGISTITVSSTTFLAVGQLYRIGSEVVQVTAINSATSLNVLRAQAGTAPVPLVGGTAISLATDQRGFARGLNGAADIGSFEVQPALALSPPTQSIVQIGQLFSQSVSASGGNGKVTLAMSTVGTLPAGITATIVGTAVIITGTATGVGIGTVNVTATDETGNVVTVAYRVSVPDPNSATITPSGSNSGSVGTLGGVQVPSVSAAYSPTGALAILVVDSNGNLSRNGTVVQSNVRNASIGYGPTGEVVLVTYMNGSLVRYDSTGFRNLTPGGVQSASYAFGPRGEAVLLTTTGGALLQFDASGTNLLVANGVLNATLAFEPGGEVILVTTNAGAVYRSDARGITLIAPGGFFSAAVAYSPGTAEVQLGIGVDGTLFQRDAAGLRKLGAVS